MQLVRERLSLCAIIVTLTLANSNFVKAAYEYLAVELPCDMQRMNNEYFIKYLGPLFVGIYIVQLGGPSGFNEFSAISSAVAAFIRADSPSIPEKVPFTNITTLSPG